MAMNGYQLSVVLFALIVLVISLWSIVAVVRSRDFRWKPVWVVGCLFGFVGLGIDWTHPNDLILLVGISAPVVIVFKVLTTGQVIIKTGFPVVSVVALAKAHWRIPSIDGPTI